MNEYPTSTVVFIILALTALGLGLVFTINLMLSAGKVMPVERDLAYYQQKQEVTNAFNNIVTAYRGCSDETDCMCEIYQLKFPSKYSIRIENADGGVRLTLLENSKKLATDTVKGLTTGLMKRKEDKMCGITGSAVLHADKKEWYVQEENDLERNYVFSGIEELYKPSSGNACLITETMAIRGNETKEDIEDYFNTLPRCSFKKKKKEELALTSFRTFVDEFSECGERLAKGGYQDNACSCDFSRISIAEGYKIKIAGENATTRFSLVNDKGKEMLVQSSAATVLIEGDDLPELYGTSGCINPDGTEALYYDKCVSGNIPAKIRAVFFENGTKAGLLKKETGILRLDGARLNRADIESCGLSKKNFYEIVWPTEKMNGFYYADECFGSGEASCSKGMSMPQKPGAGVFAADDGTIEYVGAKEIRVRHRKGLRTQYDNVLPIEGVKAGMVVTRGQKIGIIASSKNPALKFSLIDNKFNAKLLDEDKICREKENDPQAVAVLSYGVYYANPACYFSESIRNSIVYPNKYETAFAGCGFYGNQEEPKYDIRLRVLAIPVNWERKTSYAMYANSAFEKFARASPLNECPQRFKKLFADGVTDYGESWKSGSCFIENTNNCLVNALEKVKQCAEEYKARTGESYDYAVGFEDSNIANYPECNFADRGWTSERSDTAIVESPNAADALHELGHKFGLKDQYCDCSSTDAKAMCGYFANPNPLRKELGCGSKCCVPAGEVSPYKEGCMWCSGNLDMNARDSNGDNVLDSGKRTAMSNFVESDRYSVDEYMVMKTSAKLQCA